MVVRPIRALALTTVGSVAGFMAAAAFVKHAVPSRGNEESDELGLVAVFDGIDLTNRAASFRGGSVLAWYGGISLDLREATLAPGAHLTDPHTVRRSRDPSAARVAPRIEPAGARGRGRRPPRRGKPGCADTDD